MGAESVTIGRFGGDQDQLSHASIAGQCRWCDYSAVARQLPPRINKDSQYKRKQTAVQLGDGILIVITGERFVRFSAKPATERTKVQSSVSQLCAGYFICGLYRQLC